VNRKRKARQLELDLPTWGGRRDGAGRKLQAPRPSVAHRVRPGLHAGCPLHITLRVRDDVPDLRRRDAWAAIVRVMRRVRGRIGLSVVHYAVLVNHLHLIVEARDRASLSRGMQTLSALLAKALNRVFSRTGPLFAGRYHARELRTPLEVRNALRYALLNARHHAEEAGIVLPPTYIDDRSTGAIFDGWLDAPPLPQRSADFGTSAAQSWLLRVGWKRHGLIALDETPGTPRATARHQTKRAA
jgi:putative transposase